MEIKITRTNGRDEDEVHTFSSAIDQKISIGRHPSSDIRFTDGASAHSVSRRHAEIRFHDGGYWISDLHSTNGTFVNGVGIREETELHDGDAIGFGEEEPKIRVEMSIDVGSDQTRVLKTIPKAAKSGGREGSASEVFKAFVKAMGGVKAGPETNRSEPFMSSAEDRRPRSLPVGQKTLIMMMAHAAQQVSLQKRGRLGDASVFMKVMVQQAIHESSRRMRVVFIGFGTIIVLLMAWTIYQTLSMRAEDARRVGLLQTEYQNRLEKIQLDLNKEIDSWEQEKQAYEKLVDVLQGNLNREQASGDTRKIRTVARELETAVAQEQELDAKVNAARKSYAAMQEKALEELKTFSTEAQNDLNSAVEKARETLATLTTTTPTAPAPPEPATTAASTPEPAEPDIKKETTTIAAPLTAEKMEEFPRLRISKPLTMTPLKKRIGVVPITMPTTAFPSVEKYLPELLSTSLFNSGEFIIVPYIDKTGATGAELPIQEADPARPPQVIVRILVTDVIEETTQSSRSLGFLYFNVDIGSAKSVARMTIDFKAFDSDSSSLLLSRSLIGEGVVKKREISPRVDTLVKFSKSPNYVGGGYGGIPPAIADAMWKVVSQMAEIILTHLRREPWRGLILKTGRDSIVINGGKDVNMTAGDTFSVLAKQERPTDPKGEPSMLQHLERRVGTLRVEEVAETYSVARIVDREEPEFQSGYNIKYVGATKILAPGETEESVSESEETASAAPKRLLRIIDKKAKLRLEPTHDAEELKNVTLKQGDLLNCEFNLGEWYKVTLNKSRSGWLHESQIENPESKNSKPK